MGGRRFPLPGCKPETPGPGPAACSMNPRSNRRHARAPNFGRRDAVRIAGRLATPTTPSKGPDYMVPGIDCQQVRGGVMGIPLDNPLAIDNGVPAPGEYLLGSTLNASS